MSQIDLSWVREYLRQVCGVRHDLVVPNARLIYDLGLSYLDATDLIMEMEEELDVAITDQEPYWLQTVDDLLIMEDEPGLKITHRNVNALQAVDEFARILKDRGRTLWSIHFFGINLDRPTFSDLRGHEQGGFVCSYADRLHPNPRAYKHRWWVFHAGSPVEGTAFLSEQYAINAAAVKRLLAELAAKNKGCFLYGCAAPRRGEGSTFDPDSPAMGDVLWAPGFDEDTDEGVEIDGVLHK